MSKIILIDAGTGNLRSVQKALESLGAVVERTEDPQKVVSGDRVVLPGVGAFGDFMRGLRARGLEAALDDLVRRGTPLLGICVGMQALFEFGEEMGQHTGLGMLTGNVKRFADSLAVKVPHTGWNQIEIREDVPLFRGIRSGDYVYFNHSFYCQPGNPQETIATTSHGLSFACAVQRGNLFGVQFHPEKSQSVGLQLLKNFMEVT
ncbi:MAG TPA: imidazole glycerol phosphate synthase subunit HisH [Anaerolineales bacterium]|nr:imidazole glycerol phosphate synthase subunit HisH [Anaerolineales bacterium]